jgi:hypothetical protein
MARRPLATDAFTRADENPLAGSWSTYSTLTNLQVVSNAVEAAAINTAIDNIQSHTVTLPNDQWAQVTFSSWLGGAPYASAGLGLRWAAPNTVSGYLFLMDKSGSQARCSIQKYTAGTLANVGGSFTNLTIANGDVFRFETVGTQLTGFQNGAQVIQVASDASFSSGRAALEAYATVAVTDVVLDDFSAGDFVDDLMPQSIF